MQDIYDFSDDYLSSHSGYYARDQNCISYAKAVTLFATGQYCAAKPPPRFQDIPLGAASMQCDPKFKDASLYDVDKALEMT